MDRALVGNAADPKQLKRAKQIEARIRQRKRDDLTAVTQTDQGMRALWDFLEECRVFSVVVGENEFERGVMEGRRRVGLQLMTTLNEIDETLYFRMGTKARDMREALTAAPAKEQPTEGKALTEEEETEP